MVIAVLLVLPRWTAHPAWQDHYSYALVFGTLTGAMLAGFIGFIASTKPDLYFKIAANIVAVVLMIMLGFRIAGRLGNSREWSGKPSC